MWLLCRISTAVLVLGVCAASFSSAAVAPNDPKYSYQWYSDKIGMPDAWSISTGSSSVIVAVLDTGVISYTPDLAGRILAPLSAVPGQDPFTDDWLADPNEYSLRRHGTWVASAAAMTINNNEGGAGIGNFSILPIRITDEFVQSADNWIADGIRMAADNGAKVINISYLSISYSILNSAAAYARSKGALTFIAAGNDNSYRDIEDYDNLIFVAGTDYYDQRWVNPNGKGSSYGSFVDIAAPAGGYDGSINRGILLADPTLSTGYGLNSGTSFAAPLAAGAAALAWSINPNLTPDQVEQMLYSSALDLGNPGRDEIYGWGRINVAAMTQAAYLTSIPEPSTWVILLTGTAGLLWLRKRGRRL